jgi:hypothetical protein
LLIYLNVEFNFGRPAKVRRSIYRKKNRENGLEKVGLFLKYFFLKFKKNKKRGRLFAPFLSFENPKIFAIRILHTKITAIHASRKKPKELKFPPMIQFLGAGG